MPSVFGNRRANRWNNNDLGFWNCAATPGDCRQRVVQDTELYEVVRVRNVQQLVTHARQEESVSLQVRKAERYSTDSFSECVGTDATYSLNLFRKNPIDSNSSPLQVLRPRLRHMGHSERE